MRPQSAKAKGRRLQQEVRDAVLDTFVPHLEPDDVRSTSMGASGADLLLSPAARQLFPFYVECKNVESLNIWKALEQAEKGSNKLVLTRDMPDGGKLQVYSGPRLAGPLDELINPLVVFRRNNSRTYAALPFDVLLNFVKAGGPLG